MVVQQNLIEWLSSDNGLVVHSSVFGLLLLGGVGFPIPEDIPLILAGVAAAKKIVSVQAIFVVCYLGVLIGDQAMYLFGHFFGHKLVNAGTRSPLFPAINEEKIAEIREGLRRKRLLYIFIGRHLFPIRSVTFITAGALRIPFLEFLLADALAALASSGIMIGLGYILGHSLPDETIEHIAHQAHYYLAGLVLLMIGAYFLARRIGMKPKKSAPAPAEGE